MPLNPNGWGLTTSPEQKLVNQNRLPVAGLDLLGSFVPFNLIDGRQCRLAPTCNMNLPRSRTSANSPPLDTQTAMTNLRYVNHLMRDDLHRVTHANGNRCCKGEVRR